MATDRTAFVAIPAAALLLLWPAIWNGYPIVFADTGTYLSQAIHLYAGWDRPVFYSIFMLPLHATVTVWPVVAAQALLAAWVLWLVSRTLLVRISRVAFIGGVALLAGGTWLPWIVSELMPDVFTPLLVLVACLLAWLPDLLSRRERVGLVGLAAFMIASQQSSLPLGIALLGILGVVSRSSLGDNRPAPSPRRGLAAAAPDVPARCAAARHGSDPSVATRTGGADTVRPYHGKGNRRPPPHSWLLVVLPPALAVLGLCTVNLAAHGRFVISPFGNIFVLARVIYDGPGMAALRRGCQVAHWSLCPFLGSFPPTSDDFLWTADSPMNRAGGAKAVSQDANAIIRTALIDDPVGEAQAAMSNTLEQLRRFASGDGLTPWPAEVSPWIRRDFPAREAASYASARQQAGSLSVPPDLAHIHTATAVAGTMACALLLPVAIVRRARCVGLLLAVLIALPVSAAVTGSLSAPHDRYQSRIMWLPPFVAVVSLASIRRQREQAERSSYAAIARPSALPTGANSVAEAPPSPTGRRQSGPRAGDEPK